MSSDPFSMYSVTIMIGWPAKQMITSASSSKSNFYLIMKIQSRTDLIMMENWYQIFWRIFGNDVIFNQQSGRELKFFTVCVFFILENISEVVEWAYGKSDKKIFKLLFVTTPSRNITFWSSNCPIMLASVRKSKRFLSVAPGFKVFMATDISGFTGLRSFPLQTSPNSPKNGKFRKLELLHTNWSFMGQNVHQNTMKFRNSRNSIMKVS